MDSVRVILWEAQKWMRMVGSIAWFFVKLLKAFQGAEFFFPSSNAYG